MNPLLVSVLVLSAAPDWCKPMAKAESQSFREDDAKGEDARKATEAIVYAICVPREEGDVAKAEEARKTWSAKLAMEDGDWVNAAEFFATYDKYAAGPKPSKDAWAGLGPIDQYLLLANLRTDVDAHYVADAAAPLSEAGRIGYAIYCATNNIENDAHLAACAPEFDAVDLKKAAAEVRGDKTQPKYGFSMRLRWFELQPQVTAAKERIAELKKKDEGYIKMFDLATKAFKDWDANAGKRQKLIALAADMDNARISGSKKASAGCEDKTMVALREAVAGIPAKAFSRAIELESKHDVDDEVVKVIVGDPEGYLAAAAFVSCMKPTDLNKPESYLPSLLAMAMSRWPGYRGPHSAAITEIMKAGIELDQRDASVSFPDMRRQFFEMSRSPSADRDSSGFGVVKAVKAGKPATIDYEKRDLTFPVCVDYRPGKQITAYNWVTGEVQRAGTCMKYKTITRPVEVTSNTADARFTSTTRPGQFAVFMSGMPIAAWPNNGKVVSTVLGVPVK